jgi:hypothetical protein
MSKSTRRFLAVLLALQLLLPYSVFAAAVGKFTSVIGKVTMTRASVAYTPAVNTQVQVKDFIITGDKSSATLLFSDDSTIRLQPNSKLEIKEFMVKGKTRKSIFSMALGRLFANVSKFIGGDNTFEVHSPTAVCGVRGTGFEFVVAMVGTQMTTTVTCTTGVLSVSALSATGAVVATTTIVAGQTAIISATGITVSAAGIIPAGTTGLAETGTTVTTATGTGTVTTGTTAATGAGAAAGTTTVAGVTTGTVAAAAVGAAVVTGIVVQSTSGTTTTTHHH